MNRIYSITVFKGDEDVTEDVAKRDSVRSIQFVGSVGDEIKAMDSELAESVLDDIFDTALDEVLDDQPEATVGVTAEEVDQVLAQGYGHFELPNGWLVKLSCEESWDGGQDRYHLYSASDDVVCVCFFPLGHSGPVDFADHGKNDLFDVHLPTDGDGRVDSGDQLSDLMRVVAGMNVADKLDYLLSADEWPGASGMEDVSDVLRSGGFQQDHKLVEWSRH